MSIVKHRWGFARRGSILVKAIVALGLLGGLAVAGGIALRPSDETAPERDIYRASTITFTVSTRANGELQARRQTEVRSPLESQARITEIVEEGVTVKKGDLLVKLATDELENRLLEAERNLSSATNSLTVAENALEIQKSDNDSSLREAELGLTLAELDLEKWQDGDVREKRQELALALDKAERELDRLTKKFNQSIELRKKDFISEDEFERDEIAKIEAESNLKTANIRNEVYEKFTYVKEEKEKTSNVEEAKEKLLRVKSRNATQLKTKEADVEYHKAVLSKRQQEYDKIVTQIEGSTITAPTDGLVVYATSIDNGRRWDNEEPLEIGRNVYPNEQLIVLPDTSEMVAVVKIHESLVSRVQKGQEALVTIDAADGAIFKGKVESVGVMAQSGGWRDPNNREYEVRLGINHAGSTTELKPSMRCEAEVVLDEAIDVLALPVQSVFTEGDVNYVYVQSGSGFARKPLAVGRRSDEYAEVLFGLETGAEVLLRRPKPGEVMDVAFDESELQAIRDAQGAAGGRKGPTGKGPPAASAEGAKKPASTG